MSNFTDILEATEKGTVEDVKYFVEQKGVDVNVKFNIASTFYAVSGLTLLHAAANRGNVEIVNYLITAGADVNAKINHGVTPFHFAVLAQNIEVAKYLVSAGADVNAKGNDGDTPLYSVVINEKNVEVVKYLVSAGADVNAKNNAGKTPLDSARGETAQYLKSVGGEYSGSGSVGPEIGTIVKWVAIGIGVLVFLWACATCMM